MLSRQGIIEFLSFSRMKFKIIVDVAFILKTFSLFDISLIWYISQTTINSFLKRQAWGYVKRKL